MDKPIVFKKAPIPVEVRKGETYSWCSCGKSEKQPFCDGAHKGTGFRSVKFTAEKDGVVYLCGCKHTKNPPYCDGSHKDL